MSLEIIKIILTILAVICAAISVTCAAIAVKEYRELEKVIKGKRRKDDERSKG